MSTNRDAAFSCAIMDFRESKSWVDIETTALLRPSTVMAARVR